MKERPSILETLDDAAHGWSYRVTIIAQVGEGVAVAVALTFSGVTRGGIGYDRPDEGGLSAAELKALEAAADKFFEGPGRRGSAAGPRDPSKPIGKYAADPFAKSKADMVTPAQLADITRHARALGLDEDQECVKSVGCKVTDLSKGAAAHYVRHLQHLLTERSGDAAQGDGKVVQTEAFRDQMARAIAATPGAVVKDGARWVVHIRAHGSGLDLQFFITNDAEKRARCSCTDFERHRDENFRCEHILAVVHFNSHRQGEAEPATN